MIRKRPFCKITACKTPQRRKFIPQYSLRVFLGKKRRSRYPLQDWVELPQLRGLTTVGPVCVIIPYYIELPSFLFLSIATGAEWNQKEGSSYLKNVEDVSDSGSKHVLKWSATLRRCRVYVRLNFRTQENRTEEFEAFPSFETASIPDLVISKFIYMSSPELPLLRHHSWIWDSIFESIL